jgi:predicted transglutaminase-like cysteine proteinase
MNNKSNVAQCLLAGTFAIAATLFAGAATDKSAQHPIWSETTLARDGVPNSIGGLRFAASEPDIRAPQAVLLDGVAAYDHLLPVPDEFGPDLAVPLIDPIETGAIVAGVFNSVAIPIHSFPVAKRWVRIMQGIEDCAGAGSCEADTGLLKRIAEKTRGKSLVETVGIVNAMVNDTIRYRSDRSLYGKLDYWASPREILARASGDCEDFAILKMTALIRAGLPANSLSLVVLRDNRRGAFHAVLAVVTSSGAFILDNTRSKVVMDAELPNYQPLYSFSQARAWIHGTRTRSNPAVAVNEDLTTAAPGEGFELDGGGRDAELPAALRPSLTALQ